MNNYEANHDGDDNGMDGEDVDGDDNTWVETNHHQSHHLTNLTISPSHHHQSHLGRESEKRSNTQGDASWHSLGKMIMMLMI